MLPILLQIRVYDSFRAACRAQGLTDEDADRELIRQHEENQQRGKILKEMAEALRNKDA